MNSLDFAEAFAKYLTTLALMLDYEISDAKIEAYFEFFSGKGYAPADILSSIERAAETCKFFPKPAELIELMTGGKGGGKDPAVAWQEVVKAMEDIGPYGNVEFSDGAIGAAVVGLGGWPSLCGLSYDELTLQRIPARFAALYAEAVRHGRHLASGTVTGIIDRDNAAKGYALESPAIKARTMGEIMNLARSKRPAMTLIEAPAEVVAIPEEARKAANALVGKKSM